MTFEPADAASMLLGAVTAVAVAALMGGGTLRRRRRLYRNAKKEPHVQPFPMPALSSVRMLEARERNRAASQRLREHHDRSKSLQDSTVAYLVAASSALFVAFAASAAGVTVLRHWEPFHLYSASLDVAALLVVVGAFLISARRRTAWIRERSLSEFVRQRNSCEILTPAAGDAAVAAHDAFVTRTAQALSDTSRPVIEAVAAYGRDRIDEIRAGIAGASTVSKDDLLYYLASRPVYQAGWFERSRRRIHGQNEYRASMMTGLFGVALAAAAVKACATFHHAAGIADWALLVLMLAIGVGTAMTSAYVGQNIRSLRHRYGAQVRVIELWFGDFDDVVAFAQTDKPLTKAQQSRVARAVGAFEALMVAELVDWISITTDDVMEIGPT